ncbi:MAG TPA: sigma-54 dependent transcriptional regulator, partial [Thermoanaerobaculia bacterium]|nr:sigma-54 dependent transcriptional regulator [Thermoanaerobaculia bacterium]
SKAASSSAVLILGETGTGKDVIARHIHATGSRAGTAFLTLNCAALPESLVESELFGQVRDASSKANASGRGLLEEASGGTVFLNAVGSMTPAVQEKLLRALEEGAVRRAGENETIPVDVRIIAATNRDLKKAVGKGEFRKDLYDRLSVVTLVVPRLRERPEDIEPLARHFLEESVRRLGKLRVFAPETLDFLRGYSFPGNVRELRHAIEQAVMHSEDGALHPTDFAFFSAVRDPSAEKPGVAGRSRRPAGEISPERLEHALRQHGGNRVQAARALGISRATLYRLLGRAGPQTREQRSD